MNEEEKKMLQAFIARFQELVRYGLSHKGEYDEEAYALQIIDVVEQARTLALGSDYEGSFIDALEFSKLLFERKNASLH